MMMEIQQPERRLPRDYTGCVCATCRRDTIHFTLRTSKMLYYRCISCGAVWDRERPDTLCRRRDD
jgi:uncharacterized Zn finger protein